MVDLIRHIPYQPNSNVLRVASTESLLLNLVVLSIKDDKNRSLKQRLTNDMIDNENLKFKVFYSIRPT